MTSDPTRAGPGAVRETTGGGGDLGTSETGGVCMADFAPTSLPVVISAVAGTDDISVTKEYSVDVGNVEVSVVFVAEDVGVTVEGVAELATGVVESVQ